MAQDRRAATRHKTQVAAELADRGGASKVRVLNISQTGLMLETAAALEMGERIRVVADARKAPHQLHLSGTVVWRSTSMAGVKFDVALSEEDLRALVG